LLPLALLVAACGGESGAGTTGTGGSTGSDTTASSGSTTTGSGGSGGVGTTTTTGGTGGGGTGGSVADTTAPTVVATFPLSGAMNVPANGAINAAFSEAMDAKTISSASFTVKQGGVDVPGVVTYLNNTATLVPSKTLALGATFTATITTTAADLAGNKLAMDYSWTFSTDATLPKGPAAVLLGTAGTYVVLAKSAITNVPTSTITGNMGLSPAAASFITGFSMTKVGTHWTSVQVVGSVFAADNDPPTPINLTTAISDMQTAYTDAAGRPTPDGLNLGAGTIGGLTIVPGLYKWTSAVTIPTDLVISGAANDTWIFQITGNLTMAAAKKMTLIGGAKAKNIFWQVAGNVDLGTTSHSEGIIMSKTAIKMGTGASINGRVMSQTAVNLASSVVTAPAP
jgi:hypothetical protein